MIAQDDVISIDPYSLGHLQLEGVVQLLPDPTTLFSANWIVFLLIAAGSGAYNCCFWRLGRGKIKIWGAMTRKCETSEDMWQMQRKSKVHFAASARGPKAETRT